MNRSVIKLLCAVSGILFVVLCGIAVSSAVQAFRAIGTGIIGGADGPTMEFLLHQVLRSPLGWCAGASFLLFCGTSLVLLFRKPKK